MKFSSVLLVSAAGSAFAAKNGTQSVKSQCREIESLTRLTALANNQTALDAKTKNNATKADEIKAKAADATTKLTTLQSNTTLTAACDQIFAAQATEHDCGRIASMEKMAALVANQTALDAKTKNNATKADALKAKVAENADKLTTLSSNTTLTAICSGIKTESMCKSMNFLQKEVDLASNQTALDAKFKGNATKIANFQEKADKAKAKLAEMQSNTTLTSACASIKSTTGAAASGNNAAGNAAGHLQPVGATVSLVAVFLVGLFLL